MRNLAQFNWVYRIHDGAFLHGGPCEMTVREGEAVVSLPRNPMPRRERYDGRGGIRPATPEEVAADDEASKTAIAGARTDDPAALALAAFLLQELNVLRAALPVPLPPLEPAAARTFMVNFVKSRLS